MLNDVLTEEELKVLGAFLAKGKEKEWMELSELHAFLCALISGPNLIMPSEWHSYAFGDGGLEFESQEEAQAILGLLSRFNNHIVTQLRGGVSCHPILYDGQNLIDYKESEEQLGYWCSSYIEGTHFDGTWQDEEMSIAMLMPFAVLSGGFSLIGEKDDKGHIITDDTKQRESFKEQLPDTMLDIYSLWQSKHFYTSENQDIPSDEPFKKIGRNESCYCGSGKKHKKCCLNTSGSIIH